MKYLTITIPSYNSEQYLERCLDSLILPRGWMEHIEIIVVNDGSTDRTGEIADDYVRRFPDTVRVVHKENGGHGSGVNAGLALATGRYFKVLDSDDWFDEHAYRELAEKLEDWCVRESKGEEECALTSLSVITPTTIWKKAQKRLCDTGMCSRKKSGLPGMT